MLDLGHRVSIRAMISPQNENQFDSMDVGFVLQEQSVDNFLDISTKEVLLWLIKAKNQ